MKKLLIVASLIFVTACGSKTYYITETVPATDAKSTTTTSKPPRTTAPKPVYTTQPNYGSSYDEEMFVQSVYDLYPGVIYLADEDLIETGRMTCTSLRSGLTGDQLMQVLVESSGYDQSLLDLLSALAASAIVWFCPDQAWKIG